ncbi:VC0807 family protein [Streptomyces sp. NPDC052077]|uniref:VC0807 family protein n=1 Tax=Streptomyces sp. NPDC052077 TaxID=3154757 RepID=UPI00344A0089
MTTNKDTAVDGRHGRRKVAGTFLLDVGVPVAAYYVLKGGLGTSAVTALAWSTAVPLLRTGWGLLGRREVNGLPLLILVVNLVGLAVGLETGDARLMLVKDSALSSVVGIVLLVSAALGRPMMTASLKPWLVKGDPGREAAWARLRRESSAFRAAERRFTVVWGTAFVVECAVRTAGAYSVPVDTMVWLGTVVLVATMVLGFMVSGALGAVPMAHMVAAAAAADRAVPETAVHTAEGNPVPAGSTHR